MKKIFTKYAPSYVINFAAESHVDKSIHGGAEAFIRTNVYGTTVLLEAVRHTRHNRFVTVAIKEVIFHKPVFIGDLVSFYTKTLHVGSTSITIHVDVEAARFDTPGVVVKVTEAEITFVAIDEDRNKVTIGK